MNPLIVIALYLGGLLAFALGSKKFFRGTSADYFVASRSIGPFMLLMSVFGTTMTAFALVGSTGKAFDIGIGTYGLMASSSGLIHAACFFVIGLRLWAIGKRHGFVTQIQFFRARFDSAGLGYLLFPILVILVIPYLLIGVIGAGKTILGLTGPQGDTPGMFPDLFAATGGAVPPAITGAVICLVVLGYIFAGGSRATAWANTFQTLVFMAMGVLAFTLIADKLGGLGAAIEQAKTSHLVRTRGDGTGVAPLTFLTYMFIPLSVGMFPHVFQHWLTARSAKTFRLAVIAQPLCIMIVWVPTVLIGVWATGVLPDDTVSGAVLAKMVGGLVQDPVVVGLVTAGILAAIMSSLDSQFLCLGTMFTNDIVLHNAKRAYSDRRILLMARGFIVGIVALTYGLSLVLFEQNVFDLAVWCFTGFAALTPLVLAALYWRRATAAGAAVSILATAATWLGFFAMSGFGGPLTVFGGIVPAAICWFVGAAAMIVGSLLSAPPDKAVVERFFIGRER
jgi:SSS family solute:Na+ symporter